MEKSSYAPPDIDLAAQVVALIVQAHESSNQFTALEEENAMLHRENRTLQERLIFVEAMPQQPRDPWFWVAIIL